MPVKWTPDNDQLVSSIIQSQTRRVLMAAQLLLKILETHDMHIDAKKVIAAWRECPPKREVGSRI